jgi:hypothetical protein
MPIKGGTPDLRVVGEFDGGFTWIAHPDEEMERASHALRTEDGVYVVDPVDAPDLDDRLADLGDVVGVVLGLGRHKRDCAAVAARHDVPVLLPEWFSGVEGDLDAPVERFGRRLGGSGYDAIRIRDSSVPPWQEVGLFDGETLVVPESIGTAAFFRGGSETVGVHPMLRLFPPRRALGGLDPERLLVGHGEPLLADAAVALRDALDGARRNAPAAYATMLRSMVSG